MTAVLQTVPRRSAWGAGWTAGLLWMVLSLAGCAAPPPPDPRDGPCAACEFTYQACLAGDDFGPCSQMRRYCYGWCAEADTCEQACDGADWGCEAAQTKRSTCDQIAAACPAWCEGGGAGGDWPAGSPRQPRAGPGHGR